MPRLLITSRRHISDWMGLQCGEDIYFYFSTYKCILPLLRTLCYQMFPLSVAFVSAFDIFLSVFKGIEKYSSQYYMQPCISSAVFVLMFRVFHLCISTSMHFLFIVVPLLGLLPSHKQSIGFTCPLARAKSDYIVKSLKTSSEALIERYIAFPDFTPKSFT